MSRPPEEERGPARMAWFPSSLGHLPLRGMAAPVRECGAGGCGGNWEEDLRGSGESFSHGFSPLPGYLSLSKVVPLSHYAGSLLLLLAGVACLRGRWRESLVGICSSLVNIYTAASAVLYWALRENN